MNRALKRLKKHKKKHRKRDTEMLETAVDEEGYGDVKDQETIGNDKDLKLKYLTFDCYPHLGSVDTYFFLSCKCLDHRSISF